MKSEMIDPHHPSPWPPLEAIHAPKQRLRSTPDYTYWISGHSISSVDWVSGFGPCANLIKLHRHSGKVSNLVYPDFETDPHPALVRNVKLSLRTREIECFDYSGAANPPVLHRKETSLTADHPLYARFARLTAQEEKHGLLDGSATIGTREGWQARLARPGLACADIGWCAGDRLGQRPDVGPLLACRGSRRWVEVNSLSAQGTGSPWANACRYPPGILPVVVSYL